MPNSCLLCLFLHLHNLKTTFTLQEDHSGTGTEFEVNDSPRSFPDSSAPLPDSTAQVNEPDADFSFMQQFAPFIDPGVEDPFAPFKFCDEYLTHVLPPSKFTGTLTTSLIAQIDLFKFFSVQDAILPCMTKFSVGCSLHRA